ncbi:MAG: M48 family metalloprotease [Aquabacterium sp.]
MDKSSFDTMVAKVERESAAAPGVYRFKVAMLALLGLGVLATVIGFAGLGLFAIVGMAAFVALSGASAAILVLKLGKLLILLAWPLWLLVKSSLSALFVRFPPPQGIEIKPSQAPALFDAMANMRRRMKGPRFHHVLVTDDVNAAVVQRPMFGLFGWPRNYLILGLPLLESLSPQEALAVVAHEYGHLAGSHSRFSAYIYRLRNSWGTVQGLSERWQGWTGKPLQKLVGWYAPYFNAYTFVLARSNEYQADAASAELVGAPVAASALKRVHLASAQRDRFMKQVIDGVAEQSQPPFDLAIRWSEQARQAADQKDASDWLRDALARQPESFDTHPALSQRLQALLREPRSVEALPAAFAGPSAADAWLGSHATALRRQVQDTWRQSVTEPWAQRHQELQVQKQRLHTLQMQAERSDGEQLELIRLRKQLEAGYDALPDLIAFNEAHADKALALFFEADLRLSHDDDAGLGLLERVITLDPEATKPACELAFGFLKQRGDTPGAEAWGERWRQRDRLEAQRAHELEQLDVKHELRNPQDLSAEVRHLARQHVRSLGTVVSKAHLARRVLPSDPGVATYVLVLELGWWARLRKQHTKVIEQLAAKEWPMHVMICTVHGAYAEMKKKVAPLKLASLL